MGFRKVMVGEGKKKKSSSSKRRGRGRRRRERDMVREIKIVSGKRILYTETKNSINSITNKNIEIIWKACCHLRDHHERGQEADFNL